MKDYINKKIDFHIQLLNIMVVVGVGISIYILNIVENGILDFGLIKLSLFWAAICLDLILWILIITFVNNIYKDLEELK